MQETDAPFERNTTAASDDINARLNWLFSWNEQEEQRHSLFRHARDEEQMLLMRHPMPTPKAYALFGLLLGVLPPAAIFARLMGYGLWFDSVPPLILSLCIAMNIACCLVGWRTGARVGKSMDEIERQSWNDMLLDSLEKGAEWGAITGTAGGLLFFGVGALVGCLCTMPVGIVAFALFAPLHRLLARGGMIEARHFWPLACGITMVITALILNLHLIPQ